MAPTTPIGSGRGPPARLGSGSGHAEAGDPPTGRHRVAGRGRCGGGSERRWAIPRRVDGAVWPFHRERGVRQRATRLLMPACGHCGGYVTGMDRAGRLDKSARIADRRNAPPVDGNASKGLAIRTREPELRPDQSLKPKTSQPAKPAKFVHLMSFSILSWPATTSAVARIISAIPLSAEASLSVDSTALAIMINMRPPRPWRRAG